MNTGMEVYNFKKNERVDIVFSFSEFQGFSYLNVFQRLKPQYIEEGKDGVVGRLSFRLNLLPEFIKGIEEVKRAQELYQKGYRVTRRDAQGGDQAGAAGCGKGGQFAPKSEFEEMLNSVNSN